VAAPARIAAIPNIPTTKELGVDFIFSAWNAMVGPKGVPKEAVDKLVAAVNKALDDPGVKKRYEALGSTGPEGEERGPAGLQKLVETEMARIDPVLKAVGAAKK
jgi:tripartite-type tricarboxylate transporter receptor subunit TctC